MPSRHDAYKGNRRVSWRGGPLPAFAVMPISVLMQENGAIDKLVARGYQVEAP